MHKKMLKMNKNLVIINGTPCAGKTTTCEELAKILTKNVNLDCDCFIWANPSRSN